MTSLGKILIMPKGEYDNETTYTMLDLVTHNNTVWMCKEAAVGIEPTEDNEQYWMKLLGLEEIHESISLTSKLDGSLTIPSKENYEVYSVMSKTEGYTLIGNTSSIFLHSLDSGNIGDIVPNQDCTVAITYVKNNKGEEG